jgi:hypothetical protein
LNFKNCFMPIQTFRCEIPKTDAPPVVTTVENALRAYLLAQGVAQPTLLRWAIVDSLPNTLICEGAYMASSITPLHSA